MQVVLLYVRTNGDLSGTNHQLGDYYSSWISKLDFKGNLMLLIFVVVAK
jgi:hypothetical protein